MLSVTTLPPAALQATPVENRTTVEAVFAKPDHATQWLAAGSVKVGAM
jgi:hypothetical protein